MRICMHKCTRMRTEMMGTFNSCVPSNCSMVRPSISTREGVLEPSHCIASKTNAAYVQRMC